MDSHLPKKLDFLLHGESFKKVKMFFISSLNLFLILKCSNFCPDFIGHVRKRLDKKAKVNFKI